jgi:F-type H+-transporting ATPase subunit a
MAVGLHISLSAEKLFSIGALDVTNSMFTSLIVSGLLIAFALWVRLSLKKTSRPTGVQNIAEWLVESLIGLVHGVTNNKKKTAEFLPLVGSFFLFILLSNWMGLLPGFGSIGFYEEGAEKVFVPYLRAATADLNMTLALGIISIVAVQYFGLKHLKLSYLKKYFNFSNPINAFVGLLELVSEFSRIISFAFRLFGNVFAGEVLLVVMSALTYVIIPMPFYGLEIFVGFIQALVFAMLSVVFYNMATIGHDEH